MKSPQLVGSLCVAAALCLGIASIANSKWIPMNTCQGYIQFGLWQRCALHASEENNATNATNATNANTEVKCESYDPKPAWLKATIAMMMLGSICLLPATVCVILPLLRKDIVKDEYSSAAVLSIYGGVFMLIGIIVWAAKYKDEPALAGCEYSVGFYLAIFSGVLSLIGGSIVDSGTNSSKSSKKEESSSSAEKTEHVQSLQESSSSAEKTEHVQSLQTEPDPTEKTEPGTRRKSEHRKSGKTEPVTSG